QRRAWLPRLVRLGRRDPVLRARHWPGIVTEAVPTTPRSTSHHLHPARGRFGATCPAELASRFATAVGSTLDLDTMRSDAEPRSPATLRVARRGLPSSAEAKWRCRPASKRRVRLRG